MKREIQAKRARIAYLVAFVRENAPLVAQRFVDGFFTTAADDFREFAEYGDEIVRLNEEIVQLSFELDGLFPRQIELLEAVAAA